MVSDARLTIKQKLFCKHYLSNGYKRKKAALAAGYSKKCAQEQATENLQKPHIKAYIEKNMRETLEKLGAGIEYRVNAIKFCMDAAMRGESTKEGFVDVDGVVKTVDVLNKMDGSYAPTNSNVSVTTNLEGVKEESEKIEKENDEVANLNSKMKEF